MFSKILNSIKANRENIPPGHFSGVTHISIVTQAPQGRALEHVCYFHRIDKHHWDSSRWYTLSGASKLRLERLFERYMQGGGHIELMLDEEYSTITLWP